MSLPNLNQIIPKERAQALVLSFAFCALIAVLAIVATKHMPKVEASEFVEGVHYSILPMATTQEPEVKMFYTPYCQPCAMIHTPLRSMTERTDATFKEVPIKTGYLGQELQEVIITAEAQGVGKKYLQQLLKLIHDKKGAGPTSREDLAQLLESCGGNADEFRKGCSATLEKVAELDRLTKQYYVRATPTIIVNGNKQLHLQSVNSFDELEELLNTLIEA
ncbi:DsbA family protein [Vibrio kyushuensis]|uniref:DsbA family protein n=1 Tax=Vibrio kyushuensis TaxID=2910249 RepID=UPI003D116FE9